jgi:hypothetical protein
LQDYGATFGVGPADAIVAQRIGSETLGKATPNPAFQPTVASGLVIPSAHRASAAAEDERPMPDGACVDYGAFEVGFWHPFGPHGLETPDQIVERKRREIVTNGWTLWSFQYRRPPTLEAWVRELSVAGSSAVLVFCSDSAGAVDPAKAGAPAGTTDCRSFRFAGQEEWRPLPAGVRVPHPFRGAQRHAAAFVVQRIVHPVGPLALPTIEWLSDGQWRQDRVPTRGEYLIRPGGRAPIRPVRAILELREPYIALVSAGAA